MRVQVLWIDLDCLAKAGYRARRFAQAPHRAPKLVVEFGDAGIRIDGADQERRGFAVFSSPVCFLTLQVQRLRARAGRGAVKARKSPQPAKQWSTPGSGFRDRAGFSIGERWQNVDLPG